MSNRKKIGVMTGTRAEFGLLLPLMRLIESDPELELLVYVTGTHLLKEFGNTFAEIETEKFSNVIKIGIDLSSDSVQGISRAMGQTINLFSESFSENKPGLLILLGDRYETFAVAAAATVAGIPIAHLHGGELTEGAMDEAFRHSITKMSHLHFTAADEYCRRVIQMGESPDRVFNTGAIGIDNIRTLKLLSKEELSRDLGMKFKNHIFLITYHPETLSEIPVNDSFSALLKALEKSDNTTIVFTYPNADTDGHIIRRLIDDYVEKKSDSAFAFASLGSLRYLSMMKIADLVVGNSSSGIIEAPALQTPTVNIGDRQKGRLRAKSIIDCKPDSDSIVDAIEKALLPNFRENAKNSDLPYGDGHTAEKIFSKIKSIDFPKLIHKTFYNL